MHVRINYFDHVVFMSDESAGQGCPHSGTNNITYRGLTIKVLLKSGTVPEIRGPLRPMLYPTTCTIIIYGDARE